MARSHHARNPLAVALGKLAAGHKKTMSEAALNQRKDAARKALEARNGRKEAVLQAQTKEN